MNGMKKEVKRREEVVEGIESDFVILSPSGEEIPINLNVFEQQKEIVEQFPNLVKLIKFEVLDEKPGVAPPSIKLMQKMQLIDYEAASDAGHFRFYPKGALIMELLKDWADEIAVNRFEAMQIETPVLYDWNHPAIRAQAESFHERHYLVNVPYHSEREYVLRFAGDFGLFCMVGDMNISYRHLPLRIYEFSKSYRYEKSGELAGLRRLRGFSMPDVHSFCSDIDQSWEEYKKLYFNYTDLANELEVEYAVIFRAVRSYYEKYKDQIVEMIKYSGKPAIIEILSEMKHYWAVKHEFQGVDSVGGACQCSTVQLDVEDAERYGIVFTNPEGKKQGCVICHSSIGALERWIYVILEDALKMDLPKFPLWLSPSQIRIVPVSESYHTQALALAKHFRSHSVRAEVDDRPETVGNRVRLAGGDWVPYVLVFGEKEAQSDLLYVKRRGSKKGEDMSADALIREIREQISNKPFRQLSLPILLSKRPIFRG